MRTQLTTEQAQHVASNPDGCDVDEVRGLADYIGIGTRPLPQAACLFPNKMVEAIEGYKPEEPVGRLYVAKQLRAYCHNKATAMELRARGDIATALTYENICERIYNELPQWAKW